MRTLRRLLATVMALVLMNFASQAVPVSSASSPADLVVLHAINGPGTVDVYLHGRLLAGGLPAGGASQPSSVPAAAEHVASLYPAMVGPPALASARADSPIAPRTADSAVVAHTTGPTVLHLYNFSAGTAWYAAVETFPLFDDVSCRPGRASTGFSGRADIFATSGNLGGSGVGAGGAETALTAEYSRPVVVKSDRFAGPASDPEPTVFGTFDFGKADFRIGEHRAYFSFGVDGVYGAAEVLIDCASDRVVGVRSPEANPRYPTSRFIPVAPVRLFDTRFAPAPTGSVPDGGTLDVQVAGEVGIPAEGVSAVTLNVTAVRTTAPGYVTVWPTGSTQPTTANLNVLGQGEAIPNLVTVPLGSDGKVSFFALRELDLVADVSGYWTEANEATAGRFVPLTPERVFNTRTDPIGGALAPQGRLSVDVAGQHGVPPSGASAVVLNLTGISTGQRSFVTAFPGGTPLPKVANVNIEGGDDVSPNLAIVPLGADGSIDFYASHGAHLIADVFGYFTDDKAPVSSSGLFVPTSPTRVMDTRPQIYDQYADQFIAADTLLAVPISEVGDVPGLGAAAVFANVTGTRAAGRGHLTVWPSTTDRPTVASVNLLAAGVTRPNAVLVPLGGRGDISIYSFAGAHAVVDVFGYFTT